MNQDLERLCDLQIESIKHDVDASVNKVTRSSGAALGLCRQLQALGSLPVDAQQLLSALHAELSGVIVGMQFHDELNQRISHLQQVLAMLETGSGAAAVVTDDSRRNLFDRLHTIMTIRSEHEQLKKIFPDYVAEEGHSDCIEMF